MEYKGDGEGYLREEYRRRLRKACKLLGDFA